jgi:hypothetical protein
MDCPFGGNAYRYGLAKCVDEVLNQKHLLQQFYCDNAYCSISAFVSK